MMVGKTIKMYFFDSESYAEFEISDFEISRFDCKSCKVIGLQDL